MTIGDDWSCRKRRYVCLPVVSTRVLRPDFTGYTATTDPGVSPACHGALPRPCLMYDCGRIGKASVPLSAPSLCLIPSYPLKSRHDMVEPLTRPRTCPLAIQGFIKAEERV